MGNYVDTHLNKNESIIAKAEFSILKAVPNIVIGSVISVIAIVLLVVAANYTDNTGKAMLTLLGIFLIIAGIISVVISICIIAEIRSGEFAVTNKRVVGKVGIFDCRVIDLRLDKIDAIDMYMSFYGKFMNYGSIKISGSGSANVFSVYNIKNVEAFRKSIYYAIELNSHSAQDDDYILKK